MEASTLSLFFLGGLLSLTSVTLLDCFAATVAVVLDDDDLFISLVDFVIALR